MVPLYRFPGKYPGPIGADVNRLSIVALQHGGDTKYCECEVFTRRATTTYLTPMFRKVVRWFLVTLLVVVLLLAGALLYLNNYLNSNEEKLLHELTATAGLEITARRIDLTAWKTFPRVSLRIDSLVVRDSLVSRVSPALLEVRHLSGEVSLDALLSDTLRLLSLQLSHGNLHVESDSSGRFNLGALLPVRDSTAPATAPKEDASSLQFDYDGLDVRLEDMGLTYRYPPKHKYMAGRVNSLTITGKRDDGGIIDLISDLDVSVEALAFNTQKGAYLRDAPVKGKVAARLEPDTLYIAPTQLLIGVQTFDVAAAMSRAEDGKNHLYLENATTDFAKSRAMLHDSLAEKLSEYDIAGTFPVSAEIIIMPGQSDDNTEVRLAFRLRGQTVKIKDYTFRDAYALGHFVNRLDEAEGGTPGSSKNLRFDLDSVRADQDGLDVRMPHATVYANAYDTRLRAPVRLSGAASAVSERLGNRNFFFERGAFTFDSRMDISLEAAQTEILAGIDGQLRIGELDVIYRPAGVRFPFEYIKLDKLGQDVTFHVQSSELPTGAAIELLGSIDNLTPLIYDLPGEQLKTQVTLLAPRIDWTDFRAFFGQEGYFEGEEEAAPTTGSRSQSIKTTLLGLRSTFQPDLEVRIDTVAYYDVFTLTDLTTGLHFSDDTLVLERTSFDWAGSQVGFGAQLALAGTGRTPFALTMQAEHLDLNRLRPTIDYFGPTLPATFDELPGDLHIDFAHRGVIDDSLGVMPGFNEGRLDFDDGRENLFTGRVAYTPTGPDSLQSQLELSGDPRVVNSLFNAENFFFGSGRFRIDASLDGMPETVPELLQTARMRLRIDSSRIDYRPGEVFIPVQRFTVDVSEERATFDLRLRSDATRRLVSLTGELDRLSGFLLPELGIPFRIQADAKAKRLAWSDFDDFIRSRNPEADTTDFDLRRALSATGGIFSSFRPDLSLAIDTFRVSGYRPFVDVRAGVRVQDSTQLIVERSGFRLGDGTVELGATYALDDKPYSPFTLAWQADSLSLQQFVEEITGLDTSLVNRFGGLTGQLTTTGTLTGQLDEERQRLLLDSTQGDISLRLSELELFDWPFLERTGRKVLMRKRFEQLRFAPLAIDMRFDSGRVTLPRTELQSTGIQLFVEGQYDDETGADFLISIPLRNIGRGLLEEPPPLTTYARSGWKVYLVAQHNEEGELKMKFRLGKRRWFKERGRLEEWRELRRQSRD